MENPTPQNNSPKPWYLTHKFLYSVIGVLGLVVIVGSALWWQEIQKQTESSKQQTETLEGFDSDHDGVRDDVQGYIMANYLDENTKQALLQYARAVQSVFSDKAPLTLANDASAGTRCLLSVFSSSETDSKTALILGKTLNTSERLEVWGKKMGDNPPNLGPIGGDSPSLSSYCTFNAGLNVTSAWKTYTNSQYGFEFKYPGRFEISKEVTEKPSDCVSCKNSFTVYLGENGGTGIFTVETRQQTSQSYISELQANGLTIQSQEKNVVGSHQAIDLKLKEPISRSTWQEVLVSNDKQLYIFKSPIDFVKIQDTDVSPADNYSEFFEPILSTFTFTLVPNSEPDLKPNFKVGDKVGSFTILTLEPFTPVVPISQYNYKFTTKGETIITGEYNSVQMMGDELYDCMSNLDSSSEAKIPKLYNAVTMFCFSNDQAANMLKGINSGQRITVDISDYAASGCECDYIGGNNATLIKVVSK